MPNEVTADESAVQVSTAVKARPARPRGQVTVFGAWCKGCHLCVEFCPQGVLEASASGWPLVAHPARCTACHWCDMHCPDMAITVRKLQPDEIADLDELAAVEGGRLEGLPQRR